MLGRQGHVPVDSAEDEGAVGAHGAARRRHQSPDDDHEEEQPLPRHGLALDTNAWLTTLQVNARAMPAGAAGTGLAQSPPVSVPEDLQNLITTLARRVAWGGDRRRGSARIELSEGPLAGATLLVHAEEREVTVELELPGGVTAGGDWRERIIERLEERGFVANVRVG